MTLKHVLKHFSKTEVQDDERFSLAPMREREELLRERSELSNSGEGCKELSSPDPSRHPLPVEGKFVIQNNKTHPNPPLEKEGVSISCAEHAVTVFSPFTSHFSQLYTPHPSPQGARENVSCAKHTVKNLFSYSPIHLFTFKKCAFTLAEVLITLAIIGVVAAVTLPTLVQNYKKTVYVNQLKKFVSTFEQGLQKMLADEGVQRLSDLPDLGTSYDTWGLGKVDTQRVIDDFFSKGFYVTYNNATGYLADGFWPQDGYNNQVQLNDGSAIVFLYSDGKNTHHKSSAECDLIKSKGGNMCSEFMEFWVDINGIKGPNKAGRDIFTFMVSDEGKLYPVGGKDHILYAYPDTPFESNPYYWKNDNSNMGMCAARIIENGWKMDY